MSKRTVIVSGGILEKEFVLPILQSEETEFIIGVDKGLQFLYENEIKPDYIVGDFEASQERSWNITGQRKMYQFGSLIL